MKHKKIYLSLTLLVGLVSISFCSSALAWLNAPLDTAANLRMCGNVATSKEVEDIVGFYRQHYNQIDDEYKHFYSTHDYIAHFALVYLARYHVSGKYNWLIDPSRRYFYSYLLATEYPDYGRVVPYTVLDCGKSTQIKADFSIGESHKYKDCKGLIVRRESRVYQAFRKRNQDDKIEPWYETAAFYIGAVTHYIIEQAHPAHVSINHWNFHKWIEEQVSKLTTLEDFQANNNQSFFKINLENILGWNPIFNGIISRSPLHALDLLALTTMNNKETMFNGEVKDGSQNAQYLFDFYAKDCGNGYGSGKIDFKLVGRDGSGLPSDLSHLAANFKKYFDRIEELLNWAVYYTACAIKYMIGDFNGQVTPCTDNEDDEDTPQHVRDDRNLPFDTVDILARYGAIIAAFIAVGLVSRKVLGGFR